jgi:hypothetical protein
MRHKTRHHRRLNQVTIRGIEPRLHEALLRLAESEGISLNKAALRLLRKGAGLVLEGRGPTVGASLDHLIGTWSEEEYEAFKDSIRPMEQIDPEFWK